MNSHSSSSQNGNALWFILIGVALLGALTIILSRGGSSVDQSGDFERRSIEASRIMRTVKSYEVAIQQLLQLGCSENSISFWHDSNADGVEDNNDTYFNPNSPADHSCHVFDVNGGGLTYTDPQEDWIDDISPTPQYSGEWFFNGTTCVEGIGTGTNVNCNASNQQQELLVFLPYIEYSLCVQLNRMNDVPTVGNTPPQDHNSAWPAAWAYFIGNYNTNTRSISSANGIDGQHSACFEGGGTGPDTGTYHFYHVLIQR